jgi:hypothetical protein
MGKMERLPAILFLKTLQDENLCIQTLGQTLRHRRIVMLQFPCQTMVNAQ